MTETPTAAELEIPDAAMHAWINATGEARRGGHTGTAYVFGLIAAAPLVVAAELRRIADEQDAKTSVGVIGLVWLRARADELDPPVKGVSAMARTNTDRAALLRENAQALYRRSDSIPLSRTNRAGIERVGDLREQADEMMRQAAELDPPARQKD